MVFLGLSEPELLGTSPSLSDPSRGPHEPAAVGLMPPASEEADRKELDSVEGR